MNSILISTVAFVVAIGVLVTVHEFGHFWVARKLGVKVLRFSVGFGKPLWGRRFGDDDTELVVAAIPLGGYVKMLDEREAEAGEARARAAGSRRLALDVAASNETARRLYERRGWTVESRWPKRLPIPGLKFYRMIRMI